MKRIEEAERRSGTVDETETLRLDEAAKKLGVSYTALYNATKRGQVPCIRIGRRILISKNEFKRLTA